MKRISLVLISLFILVIGIGCAAAADLNNDAVADHVASADQDELQSYGPNIFTSSKGDEELQSGSHRERLGLSGPNIFTTDDTILGSGLGGSGNQNFY